MKTIFALMLPGFHSEEFSIPNVLFKIKFDKLFRQLKYNFPEFPEIHGGIYYNYLFKNMIVSLIICVIHCYFVSFVYLCIVYN